MLAFQYDEDGYLIGTIECDPHPLRAHGWIVPGMATLALPPTLAGSQRARWTGREWRVIAPAPKRTMMTAASEWASGKINGFFGSRARQ